MPRLISKMKNKERKELESEVLNVVTDFINSGGNEEFPFEEKIEEIRVKRDIDDFEMSLYMSAYLSSVIEFLENRER